MWRGKRNKRDVWKCNAASCKLAHFATYPESLILPCLLAGSREGGVVLDPFCGSGTTIKVAAQNNRIGVGIEINENYEPVIHERIGEYKRI